MANLSNDKDINAFCNQILATGMWKLVRKGKHPILKHLAKGANKYIPVPGTPSDSRAYPNFKKDYFRYIRSFLIANGTIIS